MQKLIERWMQTCAHIGLLAGGLALTSPCWAVEVSSNDAVRAVGNWLSRSGVRHDYRIGGVRTFAESGGRSAFAQTAASGVAAVRRRETRFWELTKKQVTRMG